MLSTIWLIILVMFTIRFSIAAVASLRSINLASRLSLEWIKESKNIKVMSEWEKFWVAQNEDDHMFINTLYMTKWTFKQFYPKLHALDKETFGE